MTEEIIVNPKDIAEAGETLVSAGVEAAETIVKIVNDHKSRNQQRENEQQNVDLDIFERKVKIGEEILEKATDAINNAGNAANALIDVAGNVTITTVETATKIWKETIGKIKIKDIGSKVTEGLFAECSIDDVGEVRIIIDKKHQNNILLTSDTVKECRYLKEKERLVGGKKKMYYYYKITYKNDEPSYIRISNKYRTILEKDLQVIYN